MRKSAETITNSELELPCQCVSATHNTWDFLPGVYGGFVQNTLYKHK